MSNELPENDLERLRYYNEHGFTQEAYNDKNSWIRLRAYKKLGFTAEALKDEDWEIRLEACKALIVFTGEDE
jgi:hypothetical protein